MNFFMTLGIVTVLVGYAMAGVAGVSLPFEEHFRPIPHEDEYEDVYYGETIQVRKPIPRASYLTSAEPIDKTESPQRPDFEIKGEDGKSNVHHHDEETDGGHARVARGVGRRGEYEPTPPSHLGAAILGLFKSQANRGDDKDEY